MIAAAFVFGVYLESLQKESAPQPAANQALVSAPIPAAQLGSDRIVTKVIDGDTVVVEGGDHVRLLGIDSDEKGYPCYDAARLRMEALVLGKEVRLVKDTEDKDQYGRLLRYIFSGDMNIDEEMVREGIAVARFYPQNVKYKQEIVAAEQSAIANHAGCKWEGK